ncbi:MAG: tRNA (N(6)-L-threonylcarbamoyladenosine(37)-C(2))-methylthiotransferase MtaB [Muribaculaceae bacterium]|nr:tRNA (N(6)-L-threonylcarbamoyladenosine(37)-C(2))-methylthiotransferase MtaB [Muribaculaceae bacterium]
MPDCGNSDTALKAAYHTLGCKLNFSETSTIGRMLRDRGILTVAEGETPDIVVVNTCSVTEMADKKGRQLIRRISRDFPQATIVVTGCYAQLKPEQVSELPGVAVVLGSNEKLRIGQYLDRWLETHTPQIDVTPPREIRQFMPSCERGDRTRWFLKVQDGCDYFCTYCTIPYARGRSRSGSIADIEAIARRAASEGATEIVITGVNIGEFGADTGESFLELLKRLDAIESVQRYRISSIEPNLLTEEILHWIASESRAFMPHFHIPLQAGSDRVLKLMNRRYDTTLFAERIALIRKLMPDAFIGVDVIAGARGETDEEWRKSMEFIDSLPITRLHVFPYSERPGTAALMIGHTVPAEEKHLRTARLMQISEKKHADFINASIGREVRVLWEAPRSGSKTMHGFTENYIRVEAPLDSDLINKISTVLLTAESISELRE